MAFVAKSPSGCAPQVYKVAVQKGPLDAQLYCCGSLWHPYIGRMIDSKSPIQTRSMTTRFAGLGGAAVLWAASHSIPAAPLGGIECGVRGGYQFCRSIRPFRRCGRDAHADRQNRCSR